MTRSTTQRKKVALAVAVVITLTALALWTAGSRISPPVFMALRWIGLAALVAYGCLKRTLTAWIFIAMLLGAEIGHDFPRLATDLRVLAMIFLRLIKTIIAPLLFATLTVGIAGHSNLRQVGRLGLRSIVFFEVVTTIALVIGLVAINLAKPGVGVQLPTMTANETGGIARL